jgi:hypothetical protein
MEIAAQHPGKAISMPRSRSKFTSLRLVPLVFALLVWLLTAATGSAADWEFRVRFSDAVHAEPFTGRVYLLFSQGEREPRFGPGWFNPESFVARDVVDWQPNEDLVFSAADSGDMLAYPHPLAQMRLAGYRAQAVVRFNPLERKIGTGAGNGFSPVLTVKPPTAGDRPPVLHVDKLVPEREFRETRWSKLLSIRSERLSEFHGRDVNFNAAVILPASYYEQPERRYPTIFTIPGFGGTHHDGSLDQPIMEQNERGVEFLRVLLDPSCPLGHHVFADSANNGPVGTAFIEEFLPEFDRRFRSVSRPSARFLTGHSSGGWSSLWVQVTYPEHFGGTWSTAPDPVDFRDFQRINLYRAGENMYVDPAGRPRPLARGRSGDDVRLWYRGFAEMEWVLGHGGQLHSFEAVFSPRGRDGKPVLLWDRDTGEIDTEVARTWEKYDIRLVLERNWNELEPKLRGKLHVFMGDRDTFYLEGATILLKESLERLGSDAVVEIHPGKDHSNLITPELRNRIRQEMVQAFLAKSEE